MEINVERRKHEACGGGPESFACLIKWDGEEGHDAVDNHDGRSW